MPDTERSVGWHRRLREAHTQNPQRIFVTIHRGDFLHADVLQHRQTTGTQALGRVPTQTGPVGKFPERPNGLPSMETFISPAFE